MEGPEAFASFARAGLERLGLRLDESELGVIQAAEHVYGPHIDALMQADLSGVSPEPRGDLSRAPEPE